MEGVNRHGEYPVFLCTQYHIMQKASSSPLAGYNAIQFQIYRLQNQRFIV